MTSLDAGAPGHPATPAKLCGATFPATSFLPAVLLFGIEPLSSKMVLPVLGGTAAVLSAAAVVFQGLLLARLAQ